MLNLYFVLLASACFASVISARYALLAILFIGFTQDPFRKLVVGEPFYFVIMVGVVFFVVFFSTLNRVGFNRIFDPFIGWTHDTKLPLFFFVAVLALQLIHSLVRYGNPWISVIGLMSYIAPFLGIMVGYYAINSIYQIRQFLKIYVMCGFLVALTVLLSFSGLDLKIFKEVGEGLKIYDQGSVLRSFSGVMRTGEIAAWHLASSACMIVILYLTSPKSLRLWIAATLIVVLLSAVALTGRRKMLMLFTTFALALTLGLLYFRQNLNIKYLVLGSIVLFGFWVGIESFSPGGYGNKFENYLARGTSVYNDASGRFIQLGFDPVSWAYNRVGVLGGGLGIASQGSRFFNVSSIAGGSAEGGLGKVMVELGLPGLLVIVWLVLTFIVYFFRALRLSTQPLMPKNLMPLMLGLAMLLLVNVLTFSVATQVYGDMFVLIMLGLIGGFLFALPKLAVNNINREQLAVVTKASGSNR